MIGAKRRASKPLRSEEMAAEVAKSKEWLCTLKKDPLKVGRLLLFASECCPYPVVQIVNAFESTTSNRILRHTNCKDPDNRVCLNHDIVASADCQ